MTKAVRSAIDSSISFDQISWLDHDADDLAALQVECDDSVDANECTEFWGTRGDGGRSLP